MRMRPAAVAVVAMASLVLTACSSANDDAATSTSPTPPTTQRSVTTDTSSSTTSSSTTSSSTVPTTPTSTPTPTTTSQQPTGPRDPLTGLDLSPNPVIAVKIDNTSFPQFGVADADIIYTEQVEGGLTRLIAMYHTTFPEEVGPVRSIRSTDFQLLPSYGEIILANSGGNTVNLGKLRRSALVGVSEGAPSFWRSNDRYAPYNLHANVAQIASSHPDQPKAKPVGFEFAEKDPTHLRGARSVSTIDVTMIVGETSFTYVDGHYEAYHGSHRYVDADGTKVNVDNVIVQHVRDKPDGTIDPAGHPAFMTYTVGSGEFTLYRDGVAVDGTWSRDSKTDPTAFLAADGTAVKLKPGKTWVLLAPQTSTFGAG